MPERAICIHGHFYQPPRENPWIEAIERQDSAWPYHDWNARITAECYGPNAASRVLDGRGWILDIVDNYERISFNFGPTLLSWMKAEDPEVYAAILDADRRSIERFGAGSALAQVYNHMILPLANDADRRTQVKWGIADFEHRFGRVPRGMWLPETAADVATLEALAAEGIEFTILAPHQAGRVRLEGEEEWVDADGVDVVGRPWRQSLPSGRTITIFFYDGPTSRAIAFEKLLESGERFAGRLTKVLEDAAGDDDAPRLEHVATDGETYGHHHPHGEMALSWALQKIVDRDDVELVNYPAWLDRHPATGEVEIVEDTSWSCVHGVERWRADCGCSTGGEPGWNQAWRAPLRDALDWLRDELAPRWEAAAGEIFDDPWAARDAYVEVILDRSDGVMDAWLESHAGRALEGDERVRALELLELQRHAMLMYTSCGWFFDELSRIEAVQVLQYAGRAVQLGQELFGEDLETGFLERLEAAQSNIPESGTGRDVYESSVRPAMVDLRKVAAHYGVASLFEEFEDDQRVYCFQIERLEERRRSAGRARLVAGRARVSSRITGQTAELDYAAIHTGDHTVVGGVRAHQGEEAWAERAAEIVERFERADFPDVIRALDESFDAPRYSLRSLFRDEQRQVMKSILESSIGRAAAQYAQIYETRAPLMRFMADLDLPPPRPFRMAAEFVLNTSLKRAMKREPPDLERMRSLARAAQAEGVELDGEDLGFTARRMMERAADRLVASPENVELVEDLAERTVFALQLPFHVSTWSVQNRYWRVLQETYPAVGEKADGGDPAAAAWVEAFEALGESLHVVVDGN